MLVLLIIFSVNAKNQDIYLSSLPNLQPNLIDKGKIVDENNLDELFIENIDYFTLKNFWIWSENVLEVSISVTSSDNSILIGNIYKELPIEDTPTSSHITLKTHKTPEIFSVFFDCKQNGAGKITIIITLENQVFEFIMTKTCNYQYLDNLDIKINDEMAVENGIINECWVEGDKIVSGNVNFEAKVEKGIIRIQDLKIESNSSLKINGSLARFRYITNIETSLTIESLSKDPEIVYISLIIPPFDDIRLSYVSSPNIITKKLNLDIGLSENYKNIMEDGNLLKNPLEVDELTHSSTFYISTKEYIHISSLKIEFESNIFDPEFIYDSLIIHPGSEVFKLNYKCINDGM